MMKLYYIANVRMPTEKAHGYQVAKMCETFAKHLSVALIVPTRRNAVKEDAFDYYGIEKNFSISKIFVPDVISATPLFLRKFGFALQSMFFLFRLVFLKIEKDTIVYSRNPEIVWLFSHRGYRTIFESHRWPDRAVYFHAWLVRKVTKIITVTAFLKNLYTATGFTKEDVMVASDGVDLSIFDIDISTHDAREQLGLPHDAVLLGYTGRTHTMGMEKGFANMIEAVKILPSLIRVNRRIVLVVVGGTEEKNFNTIIMKKGVNRKTLALYQKACDILLMPFPRTTHYAYYMSPLKMFEYMASRRPIVASDLPSVREVLNENNAILAEPSNPQSLADGIKKLLDNHTRGEQLAEQAHRDVQQYAWEKRARNIADFIRLSNQVAK